MAGMATHLFVSGKIAKTINTFPLSFWKKGLLTSLSAFFCHFLVDLIPHGETTRKKEVLMGIPVMLIFFAIGWQKKSFKLLVLYALACFFGMLPDGLFTLAERNRKAYWAYLVVRQSQQNHWFLRGKPVLREELDTFLAGDGNPLHTFGWKDVLLIALSSLAFFHS